MKKILTIIMLCGVVGSYAQNTPRYAASTRTWTFGNQTWSDAIHIPECNKSSFTRDYDNPQCRSYTEDGKTWYYYNWAYVNQKAAVLCPSPWRVPTVEDSETLVSNTIYNTLSGEWGYGGYAHSTLVSNTGSHAYYWSSTVDSSNTSYAYTLYFATNGHVYWDLEHNKRCGFQVRCVK
jgi:hypothetical protein